MTGGRQENKEKHGKPPAPPRSTGQRVERMREGPKNAVHAPPTRHTPARNHSCLPPAQGGRKTKGPDLGGKKSGEAGGPLLEFLHSETSTEPRRLKHEKEMLIKGKKG